MKASRRCELLSDFVYSFFEHNRPVFWRDKIFVVNCFQILYIRSLNTITPRPYIRAGLLWIAFRFCIFVLWTQYKCFPYDLRKCCELLSDFVYSFFEHNKNLTVFSDERVVNCFQILYIRSLNTMNSESSSSTVALWIAFRFCIFVLWTQLRWYLVESICCCELLSDFVYSFFEHNVTIDRRNSHFVVNCFQILYIRSLNTIALCTINLSVSCELLSDFVYSFFEHNPVSQFQRLSIVVNCFQILYIRSLNTIRHFVDYFRVVLWIAFRFCIFVLWTQYSRFRCEVLLSCELLSDFVYSFFEHNSVSLP